MRTLINNFHNNYKFIIYYPFQDWKNQIKTNTQASIYPNPSKRELFIELQPGMEGAWVELVDGTGKQIIHSQITTIPALFSPTGLKPGIYFYRIYNHNTVFKTGKWIKI